MRGVDLGSLFSLAGNVLGTQVFDREAHILSVIHHQESAVKVWVEEIQAVSAVPQMVEIGTLRFVPVCHII